MIKSMTGFGRGNYEEHGRSFIVEIKTINHRYTDISIRYPRQLSYLEDSIRKYVQNTISRGKVDIYIYQDKFNEEDIHVSVDEVLAEEYLKAIKKLKDKFSLKDDITLSFLAKIPEIISIEKEENNDEVWDILKKAIDRALESLVSMRIAEGTKLYNDILDRAKYIKEMVCIVEERSPNVVIEYKERLDERIKEICKDVSIDESRIATEVAFFADKSNITEEIVRLYSHIDQLSTILQEKDPIGRKLDFLIQEMNREINTIGSKANDLKITKIVVDIKSEIEKIREQIQNIE